MTAHVDKGGGLGELVVFLPRMVSSGLQQHTIVLSSITVLSQQEG